MNQDRNNSIGKKIFDGVFVKVIVSLVSTFILHDIFGLDLEWAVAGGGITFAILTITFWSKGNGPDDMNSTGDPTDLL